MGHPVYAQIFVYQPLGAQKRAKMHVLCAQHFLNETSFRAHFGNFPVWISLFQEVHHLSLEAAARFVQYNLKYCRTRYLVDICWLTSQEEKTIWISFDGFEILLRKDVLFGIGRTTNSAVKKVCSLFSN